MGKFIIRSAAVGLVVATLVFVMVINAPATSVVMDINPSIEIVTNRLDTVIEIKALNEDAREMLSEHKISSKSLDKVINELVELMISLGYITGGEDNIVMLTVFEDNVNKDILDRINAQIKAYLENQQIAATILNQVSDKGQVDEYSNSSSDKASQGKTKLIDNIIKLNFNEIDYAELADISIKDILEIADSLGMSSQDLFQKVITTVDHNYIGDNIDILDIKEVSRLARELTNGGQIIELELEKDDDKYIYEVEVINDSGKYELEIDAVTGKIIEFKLEEKRVSKIEGLISMDEAINIAREVSSVGTITEFELNKDDEEYIYEIEIYNKGNKYEIEIGAASGIILEYKIEESKYIQTGTMIDRDEAISIALGKTNGGFVTDLELEEDDGRLLYEIETANESMKYKLEIDAFSGKILKYELKRKVMSNINEIISIEEAIEIAKEVCSGGTVIEFELDEDDGRYVYEIEINNNGSEYELEIDALTGKVLEYEIEKSKHAKTGNVIGREEAISIALSKTNGGIVTDFEIDEDDEKYLYEIKIEKGSIEYELEIDALSGEILEFEIDD